MKRILIPALLALGLTVAACGTVEKTADTQTAEKTTVVETAKAPAPKPETTKAPKPKPSLTVAQENAIESAKDYLDMTAFSRKGLIKQLSSEYGDGFSLKDATFAVDHIKVNWNEQAARAAKSYLEMDSFSRSGLIQQLESPYGEQFTHSQAVYGVDKAGL